MLIKCKECDLQVSDKALSCPHCGYPMKPVNKKSMQRGKGRRRLPNGFGRITKINDGCLRKPYRVMVTVGKDSHGKPVGKILKPNGYFKTYNEAYTALVEYNKNPYELDSTITVCELYEKWSDEYFATLKSKSSYRTITAAWSYCSSVYDMPVKDLRVRHIKGCIENGTVEKNGQIKHATANTQSRIKSMFNLMLDYAVEYEIVDKNYARAFNTGKKISEEKEADKKPHIPFTEKEMKLLWDNLYKIPYVDVVLLQCYSGWRPQELCMLKLENIDLEKGIMIGGMKTNAGYNRTVPIHEKVRPIVVDLYQRASDFGSEYLIVCDDARGKDKTLYYRKYRYRFDKIVSELNLNPEHRTHDPRVHFVTMAKQYGVDEYAIKYIIGHSIKDITEKIYTKRELKWLQDEMQKIK